MIISNRFKPNGLVRTIFTEAKSRAFHPYLFAFSYLLNSYRLALSSSSFKNFVLATCVLQVIVFTVFWLLRHGKAAPKAGLVCTILVISTFYYLPIAFFFGRLTVEFERYRYFVPFIAFASSLLIVAATRLSFDVSRWHAYLNSVSTIFVIYATYGTFREYEAYAHKTEIALPQLVIDQEPSDGPKNHPDIYFIVLDSYTSQNSLMKYWGFDNGPFIDSLRARGFDILHESRSFTSSTELSIASTLNMTNDKRIFTLEKHSILRIIDSNFVGHFLSRRSYRVVNLSLFDCIAVPRFYEPYSSYGFKETSFISLLKNTLPLLIFKEIKRMDFYKVTLEICDALKENPLTGEQKPTFYYAHLMIPHSPYLFDRTGGVIPWSKRKHWSDRNAYLEQLKATNRLILDVISHILSRDKRKPIIIVQGDHGSRLIKGQEKDSESRTILNAIHLPDSTDSTIASGMSPYNTFRLIFNRYFGQRFEMLGDE